MNKQFFRLFGLGFIFLDLLLMNLTFAIGKYLYSARIPSSLAIQYVYLWMFFNVAWLAASWICNIYQQNNISLFESFCRRTLQAYIYFLAMIMLTALALSVGTEWVTGVIMPMTPKGANSSRQTPLEPLMAVVRRNSTPGTSSRICSFSTL